MGRILSAVSIPRLQKVARLEPSLDLADIADFENQQLPFKVRFFLGNAVTSSFHHWCPFFEIIPSFGLHSWAIDLLHTWNLGCLSSWAGLTLLKSTVFRPQVPGLNASDAAKRALLMIKNELMDWHRSQRLANLDWIKKGTEIWNLTLNMLGTGDNPILNAKAAETKSMLPFLTHIMESKDRFQEVPAARSQIQGLLTAGRAALRFDAILQETRIIRTLSPQQLQLHLMFRLAIRAAQTGNCKWYHTIFNESYGAPCTTCAIGKYLRCKRYRPHRPPSSHGFCWRASLCCFARGFVANYDRQHRIDALDLYAGKAVSGSACLVHSVHVHVGVGCVFSGALIVNISF